jgi:hypothetical protein
LGAVVTDHPGAAVVVLTVDMYVPKLPLVVVFTEVPFGGGGIVSATYCQTPEEFTVYGARVIYTPPINIHAKRELRTSGGV